MALNIEELLKREEFKNLDRQQLESYQNLISNLEGKSSSESMAIIMTFVASMPKGKSISKAEQQAMIAAIRESLSPEDLSKLDNILKMLSMF